jgi:asparaginyl-tRNA synthetase
MLLKTYEIVGAVDEKYPFSKGRINLDTLRNFYHLRGRTNTFGSVFRIRSALMKYTSDFFHNKDFLHLDPNIITINECEGAGEAFKLSDKDLNTIYKQFHKEKDESMTYKWNEDHFKRATYLTVSSQLQLEALTCCLGNCYTMNKSFRAEHSNTRKHLSEFTHLEIEMINNDFTDLMHIGEEYIKYVIEQLLKYNNDDLENLDKFTSKGLLEKINNIKSKSFITIEYKDVINEINQDIKENGSELELEPLIYGDDLGSKHEDYITKKYDNGVFVTKWPMELKSFYMKQDASNDTCYSFDLLGGLFHFLLDFEFQ